MPAHTAVTTIMSLATRERLADLLVLPKYSIMQKVYTGSPSPALLFCTHPILLSQANK